MTPNQTDKYVPQAQKWSVGRAVGSQPRSQGTTNESLRLPTRKPPEKAPDGNVRDMGLSSRERETWESH
jgi:hypothetical protein